MRRASSRLREMFASSAKKPSRLKRVDVRFGVVQVVWAVDEASAGSVGTIDTGRTRDSRDDWACGVEGGMPTPLLVCRVVSEPKLAKSGKAEAKG